MTTENRSILKLWGITEGELTKLVDDNPSLRGMLFGYVAELRLGKLLSGMGEIADRGKADDHDRTQKGDKIVLYRDRTFRIESKSLQTKMSEKTATGWRGKAQVDGSDRRTVTLSNGTTLDTTLLLRGEFDVLAVNCFAFDGETWRWQFCRNDLLPTSTYRGYTEEQRKDLIASLVEVEWPPKPPFTENLIAVLNDLLAS